MEASAVTLALKSGDGADTLMPVTRTEFVSYEKENSTAKTVQEALEEIRDNFQGEKPGMVSRVEALEGSVVGKRRLGTPIRLSRNVMFTCPSDGVLLFSATGSSGYAYATLYTDDETTKLGRLCVYQNNSSGYYRGCSMFCPKGTKAKLTSFSGTVYPCFYPLTGDESWNGQ